MSWRDIFWTGCGVVVNTSINLVADTFELAGTATCILGGAAFSLSYAIDETLKAAYFGSVNALGQIGVNISVPDFNYSLNQTIPGNYSTQRDGGILYNSTSYLHPATLRIVSFIAIGSGTALTVIGANIKLLQEVKEDNKVLKGENEIEYSRPTLKEHSYLSASTLCRSLAYTSLGSTIAGIAINYSGLIGPVQSFTYPSSGTDLVNTTYYKGPVIHDVVPINYIIDRNLTVELLGRKVVVEELINVQGNATIQYGGGLFFQSKDKPDFPIAAPAVLTGVSSITGKFFAEKAKRLRDDRIYETKQGDYLTINDHP